jgi:hypothetical protein
MTKYTKFMNTIKDKMLERGNTLSTINLYLNKVITLNGGAFANLTFLKNTKRIEELLSKYENINTRRSYTTAVVSVLVATGSAESKAYKPVLKFYREILDVLVKEVNSKPKNTKSQKQEEAWVEWSVILSRLKQLADETKGYTEETVKKSLLKRRHLTQFVLLACYTLIPPRRNKDFQLMKLGGNDDDDFNWYDSSESMFYFSNYKTAKNYGLVKIDVPNELKTILDNYIKWMGIEEGDFLLVDEDDKSYTSSASITRAMNKIFGSPISTGMLRHIYITEQLGDDFDKRKELSEDMGHSVKTQQAYILNAGDSD